MSQRGISLVETLVVVVVLSLALVTTTAYSVPMIAREAAKSGAYEIQALFQLAKVESMNRNSSCFLWLHTNLREARIIDTMGTAPRFDDELLHSVNLPSSITFESPNAEVPIDLIQLGGPTSPVWIVKYSPYGAITGVGGHVMINGGERYLKLSVFKAGATQVEHWDGSAWKLGA